MENLGLDRERRWRWASAGAIMAHEPPGRKSAQSAQSLTPDQQKVQGGKGERNWKKKATEGFGQLFSGRFTRQFPNIWRVTFLNLTPCRSFPWVYASESPANFPGI